MSPTWTLRPSREGDAEAVADLTIRTWRHAYRGVLPAAVLDDMDQVARAARWRPRVAEHGERSQVCVAEGSGGLVGFAWFCAAREHPIHPEPPGTGEIVAFYVAPELFGSGLADQLAAAAEAWLAPRFERSILWALEGNARARRFYTRRGWLADGARAPYAKPGCRGVYVVRHTWGG